MDSRVGEAELMGWSRSVAGVGAAGYRQKAGGRREGMGRDSSQGLGKPSPDDYTGAPQRFLWLPVLGGVSSPGRQEWYSL